MIPYIATHPGEIIKDELIARNMKQKELSSLISLPAPVLNDIIKGKRSINAEIALLLEYALEIPATYWLNAQNQYNIDKANINKKIVETKKNIELWTIISQYIPIKIFKKLGYINDDISDSIVVLKDIFQFSDIEELVENYSAQRLTVLYRKSFNSQVDEMNLFGWRYLAKWLSGKNTINTKFSKETEQELVRKVNALLYENTNTISRLESLLNEYGIKFFILSKFDKTPVDGISFWDGDNPTIVLSLRYNRLDNLAFSLMHEIAHVYRHHSKGEGRYLINTDINEETDLELEANNLAQGYLINNVEWNKLMRSIVIYNRRVIDDAIIKFSKEQKIHPSISLGRYKNDLKRYAIKSNIDFTIN